MFSSASSKAKPKVFPVVYLNRHELAQAYYGIWRCSCVLRIVYSLSRVSYHFAQQHCDAEGDVCYGIQIQMVADIFKENYGRYPTPEEFTDLLNLTFAAATIVTNRGGPARWYYDEKSGKVEINTDGKYQVGPEMRMDLSETSFRRPTKVQETHFSRLKTIDYTWANDRFDKERQEIIDVMTNWYETNTLQLHVQQTTH
jgi:hypothetical protein